MPVVSSPNTTLSVDSFTRRLWSGQVCLVARQGDAACEHAELGLVGRQCVVCALAWHGGVGCHRCRDEFVALEAGLSAVNSHLEGLLALGVALHDDTCVGRDDACLNLCQHHVVAANLCRVDADALNHSVACCRERGELGGGDVLGDACLAHSYSIQSHTCAQRYRH